MQNIHYYRHKDTQTHSKGKQRYPLMYCSDETRDCWPSVGVYGLWGALIPKWIFLQGKFMRFINARKHFQGLLSR